MSYFLQVTTPRTHTRLTPPGYFTYPFHFDCIEVGSIRPFDESASSLLILSTLSARPRRLEIFKINFTARAILAAVNHTCLAGIDEDRTCTRDGVVWEAIIEPGDALWLPLQWQHAIETIGSNSSFGISQPFLLHDPLRGYKRVH